MIRESDIPPSRGMTFAEYFVFMGKSTDDIRWRANADSEEYTALVTYLVRRINHRH